MRAGVAFRLESKLGPYESVLRAAGIEPVRLYPGGLDSLDSLDGLMLTGGTDVNPRLYGQQRHPETGNPDDERDKLESQLVRKALDRGLPLLAICRGMQLLNVVCGGTLIQHLPAVATHRVKKTLEPGRDNAVHSIRVAGGTHLAEIIGEGEHQVNSRHHQAVDRPGHGLIVSAVAADGVVEGIEMPAHPFALAVQWHPEDRTLVSETDRKLFVAFAEALRRSPVR